MTEQIDPDPIEDIEWKVEPFPPPPVCWQVLDDEKAAEAMAALNRWVDWLVERYGLDHRAVPACWAEHGSLIEELSALHGAWNAAYAQSANASVPLDWHANFAASRQRLSDWIARTGCRPGEHRARQSIPPGEDGHRSTNLPTRIRPDADPRRRSPVTAAHPIMN